MWNDNDKIMDIFNEVENDGIVYPCNCPECNMQAAHVYIHKHNDKHCGIWTWCSACGAYSHMSGDVPKWWKNPDFIDPSQLCADPDYLDQNKNKIDEWVNSIMPNGKSKKIKPFIMENRFDVVFKGNLQDIPEGTIGTLVIKDDFNSITIELIGIDGKINRINESPDNLMKVVEVIKKKQ